MTSILITTQDHLTDATQTKSLKVNPAAATGRLKTWAQMGVNLSKDSYVKTVRIDETDCDADLPQRTVQIALDGTNYATSDNIRVPTSVITGNEGDYRLAVNVRLPQNPNFYSAAALPVFTFANVSNGVSIVSRQANLWAATASWVFNISAKTACSFDLNVKLIAADGFDAYEHTYHVELYEEG